MYVFGVHIPNTVKVYLPEQIASCVFCCKKCFLQHITNLPPTRSRGWIASKVGNHPEIKKSNGYGK